MNEPTLRKWHRFIGIALAPFILLQVVSGLILSLGFLGRFQNQINSALKEHHLPALARFWDFVLLEIHYGGGTYGGLYNIIIALGMVGLLFTGLVVFFHIQARRRRAVPAKSLEPLLSQSNAQRISANEAEPLLHPHDPNFVKRKMRAYLLLGTWGMATLLLMAIALYSAYQMSALHVPLVHTAAQIRVDVTRGHLWLEEYISGDPNIDNVKIFESLERADQHAVAMLEGAETEEGMILPIENVGLRRKIEQMRDHLRSLQSLTEARVANMETSGSGSSIEKEHDQRFEALTASARHVESELLTAIIVHQDRVLATQILLVASSFGFGVMIFIVFYRYETTRQDHLEKVFKARHQAKEQENLYKQVIQKVADPFLIFDEEGRIVDANLAASVSLGYGIEELLGITAGDLDAEYDLESLQEVWREMLPDSPIALKSSHRRKDGTTYPVVSDLSILEWGNKKVILCLSREVE